MCTKQSSLSLNLIEVDFISFKNKIKVKTIPVLVVLCCQTLRKGGGVGDHRSVPLSKGNPTPLTEGNFGYPREAGNTSVANYWHTKCMMVGCGDNGHLVKLGEDCAGYAQCAKHTQHGKELGA